MITHFQYRKLYKHLQLPGWRISFYCNGVHYDGIYHKNGDIEWGLLAPPKQEEADIHSRIHELMLFHIYD